jgi:hypothetical protein
MIKAFKSRACASHFNFVGKDTPPGLQNLSFFIILQYKYPKKLYIYQKLDTNSCFAKLRAISNLFCFFIHPVERLLINTSILIIVSHLLKEDIDRRLCQDSAEDSRWQWSESRSIAWTQLDDQTEKCFHFSTRLQLSALLNKAWEL